MSYGAETELLLQCLGGGSDEAIVSALNRQRGGRSRVLVDEAVRHGVVPLLYRRLHAIPLAVPLPPPVMEVVRDIYLHSALRNATVLEELAVLLSALRREGIPTIALKGAHLAGLVYADPALRPMSDLDLLVRPNDLERAQRAFLELGYTAPEPRLDGDTDYARHHHLPPFRKAASVPVEVHWTLTPPETAFAIDLDGLWERAWATEVAGVPARVLSPEDLVLHLCLHASYHNRFRIPLLALCDLAAVIERHREDLDWRRLAAIGNADGRGRLAWCTLRLVRRVLGTRLHRDVYLLHHAPGDAELIDLIRDSIAAPAPELPWWYRQLGAAGSWGGRAHLLLRSVFPPPEKLRRIYGLPPGSPRVYVCYLTRPADLLLRRGRLILGIVLRLRGVRPALEREARRRRIERWLVEAAGA